MKPAARKSHDASLVPCKKAGTKPNCGRHVHMRWERYGTHTLLKAFGPGQAPDRHPIPYLHRVSVELLHWRNRNPHLFRQRLGSLNLAGRSPHERLCDSGLVCGRFAARRRGPAPTLLCRRRGCSGGRCLAALLWPCLVHADSGRGARGLLDRLFAGRGYVVSRLPHR